MPVKLDKHEVKRRQQLWKKKVTLMIIALVITIMLLTIALGLWFKF